MEIIEIGRIGKLLISVQKSDLQPHFVLSTIDGTVVRVKLPRLLVLGEELKIIYSNTKNEKSDQKKLESVNTWLKEDSEYFEGIQNIDILEGLWKLLNNKKK